MSSLYVHGNPVYGPEKFYDREEDLQKVLDTDDKLTLFMATRRSGKTSLCYQLKHLCENHPDYASNVCVFWNLQGKHNASGAKRRLCLYINKQS